MTDRPTDRPTDELMSTQHVAKLLGRAVPTITMHARNHAIGRLVGRSYVFTHADVDRLRAVTTGAAGRPRAVADRPTDPDMLDDMTDRMIVRYVDQDGLSFAAIARHLDVSRETVRKRYRRATGALQAPQDTHDRS